MGGHHIRGTGQVWSEIISAVLQWPGLGVGPDTILAKSAGGDCGERSVTKNHQESPLLCDHIGKDKCGRFSVRLSLDTR